MSKHLWENHPSFCRRRYLYRGRLPDSTSAVNAANNIWSIFGPATSGSSVNRPFGSASIDGFDFDSELRSANMVPFANQLCRPHGRLLRLYRQEVFPDCSPQCPYPDSADNAMLSGAVFFDAIWVQFYNNYCGLQSFVPGVSTQNNFNFQTWDNWAKTVSKNPNVKVLLGVPGSSTAAGSGYETGSTLASIISYCEQFSSFGGVMTWDISQVYANAGFLDGVHADLGGGGIFVPLSTSSTMTTTKAPTSTSTFITVTTTKTTATSATPTGSGTVPQWGQCGGSGYRPNCLCCSVQVVALSVWWSQCEWDEFPSENYSLSRLVGVRGPVSDWRLSTATFLQLKFWEISPGKLFSSCKYYFFCKYFLLGHLKFLYISWWNISSKSLALPRWYVTCSVSYQEGIGWTAMHEECSNEKSVGHFLASCFAKNTATACYTTMNCIIIFIYLKVQFLVSYTFPSLIIQLQSRKRNTNTLAQ